MMRVRQWDKGRVGSLAHPVLLSVSDLIDGVDDAAVAVAHDGDRFVGEADFFRFAGQRDGALVEVFYGRQFNSGVAQALGAG